jgi:hypothetical protein
MAPKKRRDLIVRPPDRHAKLEVQDPDVVEPEFLFHCIVWEEQEYRGVQKLVACIPVRRKDEFIASEKKRAGFDASLKLHSIVHSTDKDPRRAFESAVWICTSAARREKDRQARQQLGVAEVVKQQQRKKIEAQSQEGNSGRVIVPRISSTLLGKACSSADCAYSLTVKVYQCDATLAY